MRWEVDEMGVVKVHGHHNRGGRSLQCHWKGPQRDIIVSKLQADAGFIGGITAISEIDVVHGSLDRV